MRQNNILSQIPKKYRPFALIAILIVVLVAGCAELFQLNPSQPAVVTPEPATTAPQGSSQNLPGWLAVYFTDPNPPDNLGHGIDQNVQPVIDGASKTIDVTSFDLNLPDMINALANASKRGVRVRMVYDGTNGSLDVNNAASGGKPFDSIKILTAAKVKLVDGGRSNGLMHDKIIIVDSQVLFLGSWNLSYKDT